MEYLGGRGRPGRDRREFAPDRGRRLGVLVDHLVPGSKESRIAEQVARGPSARTCSCVGHPYIDIWQAVKPARVGLEAWPTIPRGTEWKHGICAALGLPHEDQADIARAWQLILAACAATPTWSRRCSARSSELIDFVTQDTSSRDHSRAARG